MGKFQQYMFYKNNRIIVVFDAGPFFYPSCQWHGAVEVWYAGQDQTADDFLKKWLTKHQGLDVLLVSSDREVRNWAQALQLSSISSQDFYTLFSDSLKQEEKSLVLLQQTMHKTKAEEHIDAQLDLLLEQSSRNLVLEVVKNEYNEDNSKVRIRNGKKTSKIDKAILRKINKI